MRATLNSLAMSNVAAVLNSRARKKTLSPFEDELEEAEENLEEEIKSLEEVFREDE